MSPDSKDTLGFALISLESSQNIMMPLLVCGCLPAASSAAPSASSSSSSADLFVCVGKLRKSCYNVSVNHIAGMLQLLVAASLSLYHSTQLSLSLFLLLSLSFFLLYSLLVALPHWLRENLIVLAFLVGRLHFLSPTVRRLFWQFRYVSGKTGCLP